MKRTNLMFTLTALMIAVAGCAKAPDTTRIGSSGGVPADTTASVMGLTFNGVVIGDSSAQTAFTEGVRNIMEWVIPRNYVGSVSAQGGTTGVFAAGRVALASGQPLVLNNTNSQINVNSVLLLKVIDSYKDQPNVADLPGLYFQQATGSVSGNNVHIKFYSTGDANKNGAGAGSIVIDGQIVNRDKMILTVTYDVQRTVDGANGHAGTLGALYIPTCQFFTCQ